MGTIKILGSESKHNTSRETQDRGLKEEIKLVWRNYFLETSLHGCSSIPKSENHWIRRFVWFILVTVSATVLFFYMIGFYNFYNTHPFITKSRVERVRNLPLPAISICDRQLKKSMINNSDVIDEYDIAVNNPFVHTFGRFNVTEASGEEIIQLQYPPLEEFGKMIEDVVLYATVNGKNISIASEFSTSSSLLGRCFTFNNVRDNGQGGDIRLSHGGSLHMILNISQEDYIPSTFATGAYIMLHDPLDVPSPSSLVLHLPPGFATTISLSPTKFKFLPKPYKSYGEDYCIESLDDAAERMKWHKEYTYFGCIEECMIMEAVTECQCRANINDFPEFLSNRACTDQELNNCITPVLWRTFYSVVAQNVTICTCPQPCESIQYDVRTSLMSFPSKSVANFLIKRGAATAYQNLRDNYLSVNIGFERMILQHVEHVPEFDASDILGRLGGQMGLFLGASFLTLTELVETMLVTLCIIGKAVLRPWKGLKVGAT